MIKILKRIVAILGLGYCCIMAFLFFKQEKFFFHPKTLDTTYTYEFNGDFEEINIPVDENNTLNSLLFKSPECKGVILYLHGNAGALHDWGLRAPFYNSLNYDVLFVDYRGFGKNNNQIESEDMLHQDMQKVYDYIKTRYSENNIVVLGFSIGSGLATKLAATNNPKHLILEAPYYSFESLVKEIAPLVPSFLVRYKIRTDEYIKKVQCPITIFHGKNDQLITATENGKALQLLIPSAELHLIDNCLHNGIYSSDYYIKTLPTVLQ